MPARTLIDFFAGFFYAQTEEGLKVDMRITVQNDLRKSNRRQSPRRKGNVETAGIVRLRIMNERKQALHFIKVQNRCIL